MKKLYIKSMTKRASTSSKRYTKPLQRRQQLNVEPTTSNSNNTYAVSSVSSSNSVLVCESASVADFFCFRQVCKIKD